MPAETGGRATVRRWAPAAAAAGALAVFLLAGGPKYVSLESLTTHRAALTTVVQDHPALSVLGLVAAYAGLVAISFPGASLLTLFAGFMFGTWLGGSAVVVGATLGATAIFLTARSAVGETLVRKVGPAIERLRAGFQRDAFSYLLILRLAPAFPFWLVNIAAALLGARLRTFVVTTFLGIIPGTFVYAAVGAGAGAVLDAGRALDLSGVLLRPAVIGPLVGLAALSLIPIAVKRFRRADA